MFVTDLGTEFEGGASSGTNNLSASLVVSLFFCNSLVAGADKLSSGLSSEGGATRLIYQGVKMRITAIKAKAKRVLRSIYFCTGSGPPEERGLQRRTRLIDKSKAREIGNDSRASIQYCEQVGLNRQFEPKKGERAMRYSLTI